jgi:hypothetical protein
MNRGSTPPRQWHFIGPALPSPDLPLCGLPHFGLNRLLTPGPSNSIYKSSIIGEAGLVAAQNITSGTRVSRVKADGRCG